MTEYEFIVVQMSKINTHVLRFFHLSNARTQRVSALWCEKIARQVHYFWHLHVNKFISVINLTHTRHKIIVNDNKDTKTWKNNVIKSFITASNKFPPEIKWIKPAVCEIVSVTQYYGHAIGLPCIVKYQWMVWTGLFRFLNSCHWLLMAIHINECMN